eukprot:GDKI01020223.1.p2 GENE.GDKI01020223.1~~GDKI01020223.1.p2  ORF type:complete len:119 (-),score=23.23 GDKI01020223.1:162-518(-)
MSWYEWFPYEPKPAIPQTDPILVPCEAKKIYWYCSCGKSKSQPWCDGAHKGTPFKPIMYIPPLTGHKLICGCKQARNRPKCDGGCFWVKANVNTPRMAAAVYGSAFAVGIITSMLFHP